MASGTPVGNMIIRVDLDAVGLEKSMTGLQRQLKTTNTAMGAQLSAFDRGEKSASKYGVLIEGLSNRHKIQGQMVEEARAKYNQMSETYGENSVKAQQASQQLNQQIKKYQETGRELNKVQAEYKEFQRLQEIQSKGWYQAADSMEQWGGKLKATGKEMDRTGQTLTKKVSVPLGLLGGIAIKTGSDFESGMSRVQAISGASGDDMVKLEAKAREMGATTVFSAKEASDAFYYMSLAGWDASESMDGIAGVMDLAAASGEDLASVADIVTDGLTAFGLKAKDSGRMADVLASASANANTDVRGLGQAFQYVAPVAGSLGYTMEDTSKAIGLMANAGIKSTKAGTALRTMMTNLAKPTDAQAAAMKRYGISLTDSEGNMKSFDQVMLDLRKNLGRLDKQQQSQAAATIFGKEAMSGALAIVNASEEDYQKLSKAIKESDGSAKDMAETMQDNLQGSVKELRSMMEDLFITMYKNLKPSLESTVDSAKDLTQWFANLSPETQELITKFGLLAFAGGPVISMSGKLTSGIGSVMETTGGLVKAIGTAKGSGLVAGLNYLGPGAVAGIAVAGIGAVAYGVHHFKEKAIKAKEVNLDLAESFSEQANDLQGNVDVFEKLSKKAKVSNEQLAELNDLNIRISESNNSEEIKKLKERYKELAEESGLSKDELKELFEANKNIIQQSPEVKASITEEGNAFVGNTEKVKEYIAKLHEMTAIELKREREKTLERQAEIQEEINQSIEIQKDAEERLVNYGGIKNKSAEELDKRYKAIHEELKDVNLTEEARNALNMESTLIKAIARGDEEEINRLIEEGQVALEEQLNTQRENTAELENELGKLNEKENQLIRISLQSVGINEEGEKGLQKLDESIAKSKEEIEILDEKRRSGKDLTLEEINRYEKLEETLAKQQEVKSELNEELGLYTDINSLVNGKIDGLTKGKKEIIDNIAKTVDLKEANEDIVKELDRQNKEHEKERQQLEENRKVKGANKDAIDFQIQSIDNKIAKNAEAKKAILEELGIWKDIDKKTRDGINNEIAKGKAVDGTIMKLGNQNEKISNSNKLTDIGIGKEKERTAEAGRGAVKGIKADDKGSVARIDKVAMAPKDKTINMKESGLFAITQRAQSPVNKTVNLIGKGKGLLERLKFWAKGTPPSGHPGGLAVVGDGGGSELVRLPDGRSFLSPSTDTLLNLPKGTHVTPHRTTKRIMNSIPFYAEGTRNWENSLRNSEFARLLAVNSNSEPPVKLRGGNGNNINNQELQRLLENSLQQNALLKQTNTLLLALLEKDYDVYLGREKVGEIMDDEQGKRTNLQGRVVY